VLRIRPERGVAHSNGLTTVVLVERLRSNPRIAMFSSP
jgi:hypothetical protein